MYTVDCFQSWQLVLQWKFGITRSWDREILFLTCQIFCYISSQYALQNKANQFIGTAKKILLYHLHVYLLYIRDLFISSFQCI